MSKKELLADIDKIAKQNPQLNKQYPERRNKPGTYVVDMQSLEAKDTPLNDFERECIASLSVNPSGEMRLLVDLNLMTEKFPQTEQLILQKKQEGWTEQEIADFINKARRTVIRKLNVLFRQLRFILK